MKRLFTILLALILLLVSTSCGYGESVETTEFIESTMSIETTVQTEPTEPETEPELEPTPDKYSDDLDYEGFIGRLYVPDVGIDVALYSGIDQLVTDRQDSANIFKWMDNPGEVIADHNYQDFDRLFYVQVGTCGYIELIDGSTINIECVDIVDGYSTGFDLTDGGGSSVMGKTDYIMYTCRNGWQHVRICLWNIIDTI